MIKANELRIGNYVYDNLKQLVIKMHSANGILNVENKPSEYNPIEITEEILLKFGFTQFLKNNYWYRIAFGSKILNISISGNLEIENINGNCINIGSIDYVHQLQNLYFVLTGEELVFSSTEP